MRFGAVVELLRASGKSEELLLRTSTGNGGARPCKDATPVPAIEVVDG
jgi:hypothetical protein